MLYDAFISHASEDKEEFVRPFAEALTDKGLNIWYDEFSLRWGDSLRRVIDKGLRDSDIGIVILSHNFFMKEFPQRELDGLAAREDLEKRKIIYPIWHNISKEEVAQHSPVLADKFALKSMDGIPHIVEKTCRLFESRLKPNASSRTPIQRDFGNTSWHEPLAPVTFENLLGYASSTDSSIDWSVHSRGHYTGLRILHVNTMAQLVEAVDDRKARESLTGIYQRLLGRRPDWAGIFAYQPWIFLEGDRGKILVEQSILASEEYRKKKAAKRKEKEKNKRGKTG